MNKRNALSEGLHAACRTAILEHEGDIEIAPARIAQAAVDALDPRSKAPSLVAWGCNLTCCQIAREILRGKFDSTEDADEVQIEQHPLFPDLQLRYPTCRPGGPKYVLLEHITQDEIDYNVSRLRASGKKRLQHANALEAWGLEERSKVSA